MELEHATSLRNNWGNRPCAHPDVEKEYDHGMSTGDYVCTTCGRGEPESDWNTRKGVGDDESKTVG